MPSGGAGKRNDHRCRMRLKLLEFVERSKEYQRPILLSLTVYEQNFSSCAPSRGFRWQLFLECPWLSWYKVDTSAPTLPRARGRAFRAFFQLGAPHGLTTGLSVIRIGMLGTRGVPASYSGFETCVEELGTRLA